MDMVLRTTLGLLDNRGTGDNVDAASASRCICFLAGAETMDADRGSRMKRQQKHSELKLRSSIESVVTMAPTCLPARRTQAKAG